MNATAKLKRFPKNSAATVSHRWRWRETNDDQDQQTRPQEGTETPLRAVGKDTADLAGGKTIFFRTEPTVFSPAGRDYSMSGIPPDLSVRDLRSKGQDDILLQALELAKNGGKEHGNPN